MSEDGRKPHGLGELGEALEARTTCLIYGLKVMPASKTFQVQKDSVAITNGFSSRAFCPVRPLGKLSVKCLVL